jgi:hypothetical protein
VRQLGTAILNFVFAVKVVAVEAVEAVDVFVGSRTSTTNAEEVEHASR